MKYRIKIILTVLSITFFAFAHAQDKRPVTLNEAIDLSIKNSKQLTANQILNNKQQLKEEYSYSHLSEEVIEKIKN